jgi:hypothetical protein
MQGGCYSCPRCDHFKIGQFRFHEGLFKRKN